MSSSPDAVWRRCAHPGRVVLPLIDQEPGQQASRHDNLRTWGIDPGSASDCLRPSRP
ncbi:MULTISPECIES: hypothetical protein [Streptomyces]|nr:hypothetical protein [Streptomyces sp. CRPSP2-6A1]MBJ7005748.1 hypothetical protein [Streptomyces sp. CRPSP2-6A1]